MTKTKEALDALDDITVALKKYTPMHCHQAINLKNETIRAALTNAPEVVTVDISDIENHMKMDRLTSIKVLRELQGKIYRSNPVGWVIHEAINNLIYCASYDHNGNKIVREK